eukprot:Cvel_3586.t1-p1 / transcript=Cvel_3586.t1 / gene=Cvel_3586 / organism=Chromera_velia_CCMP2878 / gene_product=hypothetical protein / transcript_product=hypothetical protein / location=Cvel_scaffold146:126545-126831(+) / protein_length=95 / sequence_SO=supercontig / SO=protein_coding / is_pseudo=false
MGAGAGTGSARAAALELELFSSILCNLLDFPGDDLLQGGCCGGAGGRGGGGGSEEDEATEMAEGDEDIETAGGWAGRWAGGSAFTAGIAEEEEEE